MTVRFFLFISFLFQTTLLLCQSSQAERDSITKYTRLDHVNMMDQLGIPYDNLRPGASGDPNAPNAANRYEDKVNDYTLPDPLTMRDGTQVPDSQTWWDRRRPELVSMFESEVYGRMPEDIPSVSWKLVSVKDTVVGIFPITEKMLVGVVDNTSWPGISVEIQMLVATPRDAKSEVPVVLHFGFINSPWNPGPIEPIGLGSAHEPTWKEQLISKNYGYAIIVPHTIQADNGAGLTSGIIGLCNKGEYRTPGQWGTLRAWAWGASRAIDYFETEEEVDASRIAIEGLSRYGKAAIVAMAFEPRISLGFIGSSGAGGAKILRRVFGEQVENLASTYAYHWFCGNFIKYASVMTPDDLPVDAHELIALCAPRPVFIGAGSPYVEGQWIDAKGMFLAAKGASPVYELLGGSGLGTSGFPALGMPLVNGDIAWRQHAGGHSTGPNWSTWIAWACRYWAGCQYYHE